MLKWWELSPSPNNLKVRLALRFKQIAFEAIPVDPFDRAPVLAASGQELTPVIEDRGVVLNDSEAILQYLDANYPDSPRLYPRLRAGRRACDAWKRRVEEPAGAAWLDVFLCCIGRKEAYDPASPAVFRDALSELNDELGSRDSFHDDPEMAICDLRVAEFALYALPGDGLLARVGLFKKFRRHFEIPAGSFPNLERFLERWNDYAA